MDRNPSNATAKSATEPPHEPLAFSFAAAGWLKMYYFGVAYALMQHQLHHNAEFAGSSAGALVAAAAILDLDFREIRDFALKCVQRCHGSFTQAFRCHKFIEEIIDQTLACQYDVVNRLNNRINVSVTTLPSLRKRVYNKFESTDHLRQVMLASCRFTPIAGFPFLLDGQWVFDGGLADMQPMVANKRTVTVSVFYFSQADIKPSVYLPLWWTLYPPRRENFEWVFDLGYHDAHNWIEQHIAHPNNSNNNVVPTQVVNSAVNSHESDNLPHNNGHVHHRKYHQHEHHHQGRPAQRPEHPHHYPSWPYHPTGHDRSFARFFGHNSILQMVPTSSLPLELWLLLVLLLVVRPITCVAVYVELVGRLVWNSVACAAMWLVPRGVRQSLLGDSTEQDSHQGAVGVVVRRRPDSDVWEPCKVVWRCIVNWRVGVRLAVGWLWWFGQGRSGSVGRACEGVDQQLWKTSLVFRVSAHFI